MVNMKIKVAYVMVYIFVRWLAVRMECLSNCLVLCAAVFAVFTKDMLSSGVLAMCVTYTMNVSNEVVCPYRSSVVIFQHPYTMYASIGTLEIKL